jgi:hypothetical protein
MKCPRCGSPHVSRRCAGEVAGGKLGALLGASVGAASAMRGARIGAILTAPFGPGAVVAGGITGAVITGIFTGSLISTFGSAVGHLFDREVLNDRECGSCGHMFHTFEGEVRTVEPRPASSVQPEVVPHDEQPGGETHILNPGGV